MSNAAAAAAGAEGLSKRSRAPREAAGQSKPDAISGRKALPWRGRGANFRGSFNREEP